MNTCVTVVLCRSPSQAFMYMLVESTFMDSGVYVFCLCFRCV